MKRRMAMLVAVSAVSGVMTLFSPTTVSPAQAAEVCAGQGSAQLTTDTFYYPVIGENSAAAVTTGTVRATLTPGSSTFAVHLTTGICLPSLATISAAGSVQGWCGLSFGSGTTSFGQPFHWVGVGSKLILTGGVTGAVNAAPNALTGDSCAQSPGADDFIVTGGGVGTTCTITLIGTSTSVASIAITSTNISTAVGPGSAHVTTNGHLHPQVTVCAG